MEKKKKETGLYIKRMKKKTNVQRSEKEQHSTKKRHRNIMQKVS